jgi:AsmA family
MKKIWRWLAMAVLLVLAVGFAAPRVSANRFRPRIQAALEAGLNRPVELGAVHLNLFTGPGFSVDNVLIGEDPAVGLEPFAHVESLEARIRWTSLLSGHLAFSSLRLDNPSVNVVKLPSGPWNIQPLLDQHTPGGASQARNVPDIQIRGGRIDFKFGDTKSVFFFNRADLDVAPSGSGAVELRFGGEPSRTDRAAQNFGNFFVNGRWTTGPGSRLDFDVDLERSSLDEVSRLIDPRGFGLHGIIALKAQLSGAPSQVQVAGQLQIDDVHRWDLLPQKGGWRLPFEGALDLRADKLELASTAQPAGSPGSTLGSTAAPPLALEFHLWDFLTAPRWEAGARLNQVPLAALVEVVRHMGAPFPDTLAAEGGVSGTVSYTQQDGLSGRVELLDASLTLPDAEPLRAVSAVVDIGGGSATLENATVEVGTKESADVEAAYTLKAPRELDLRIATRGLNIAYMRSFGVAAIPLLDQTRQGTWKGWASFHNGEWSGEYELQNARIPVEGLADPLRIQSAAVKLSGKQVSVTGLRAKAGGIAFRGDYRWEPDAVRPHKFNIAIEEADIVELERLLAPALVRERGFLARTLRLDAAPAPDWLKARRADGTVSIGTLTVGDTKAHLEQARMLWDKTLVRFVGILGYVDQARVDQATAAGDLEIDMEGNTPHYHFDGKLQELPYKGGKLDFEGTFEADGMGAQLLETAHAEGWLHGRSVAFAPDAEFRTASACFEMQGGRWKLSSVEVALGADIYTGTGASQADGKLLLELARGNRQVRYSGPLFALGP